MVDGPGWIISCMLKRFDHVDKLLQQNPLITEKQKQAEITYRQLKATLDEKQLELLKHWEDQVVHYTSLEKESIYRHGFMDGVYLGANTFDHASSQDCNEPRRAYL